MSKPQVITAHEADALCEVSGGYGCALLTAAGVTSPDARHALANTLLAPDSVASYCARARHFSPTPAQLHTVAELAHRLGSLAFEEAVYAEVCVEILAEAGVESQCHLYDAPHGGFVAAVVFP